MVVKEPSERFGTAHNTVGLYIFIYFYNNIMYTKRVTSVKAVGQIMLRARFILESFISFIF